MFMVNSRNTRTKCEQGGTRCHWRRSGVFIVNFEHISHLVLVVFLLLTLSREMPAGSVFVLIEVVKTRCKMFFIYLKLILQITISINHFQRKINKIYI